MNEHIHAPAHDDDHTHAPAWNEPSQDAEGRAVSDMASNAGPE
jgi:hypothetical protein